MLSELSQGEHYVKIYANDSMGNMGVSDVVYFSVDTLGPEIRVISPSNQSYDATDIQLTFIVEEDFTFLAYSLDGQANVPIVGNVTLVALSDGGHRLTVYATDAANSAQETVYFNIAPFPILTVVAALTIIIIVVAAVYIVWKYKNKT